MARTPWWELDGKDAYDLLGVPESATREEIASAHRRQMKLWHTDTNDLAEAEKKSRYLNKAREVLENHRAAYDEYRRELAAPPLPPEPDPWDEPPDDPWEEIPDDPWDGAAAGPPAPPPAYAQPQAWQAQAWQQPQPSQAQPWQPQKSRGGCVLAVFAVAAGCVVALYGAAVLNRPHPSASVPERFAGTWVGVGTPRDGDPWKIELTLRGGKHNGKVDYLSGECRGTAVPVSYDGGRLEVRTEFPDEIADCNEGNMHLARHGDGKLNVFYWNHAGTVQASGTLTRRH